MLNSIPEAKAEAEYTQFRQAVDRVPVMFACNDGIDLYPALWGDDFRTCLVRIQGP